jgi:hypothetical protein
MEHITREVFDAMLKACTKSSLPTDIIKAGVEVLQYKTIDKSFKKEIIKNMLQRIAYGKDAKKGTDDDILSQQTLELLIVLIDTDIIDTLIDGVVVGLKKVGFRNCFNRFGILIQWKFKLRR